MSLQLRIAVTAVLLLAAGRPCFGQAFTANLTGVATDPAGSVIPGVVVKLKNTATNETRQAASGTEGRYTISQLLPGNYELTAEVRGFKTFVQRGITLLANQSAELNFTMQIGEIAQTVEVTESVVAVDSQTANQSVTMNKDMVQDLPVNARNPFVHVHATAGVVAVRTGISTATQDQNHNRFAFNGGRDESALILLDGVPATTGDWSALIIAPSVDSVQEVQVIRNSYEAQFGKSGGGVVSMVTRGGQNEFHGTAWEFLRNDNLDANSWANNRAGRPKTEFQRSTFGGNLGGPVWKAKRLYFFGGYEGQREGNPGTLLTTVPTGLQRQGDFSQTFNNAAGQLAVIYNPFTTRPNPAGAGFVRDPFPGNRIPGNMFDPVGVRAIALYPAANQAGDPVVQTRNFFGTGKRVTTNDRLDARIDWAHNEKHTFYVRVSKAWQKNFGPRYFGPQADSNFDDQNPRHHVTIGNTFLPNPTTVLNILIGTGRWREEQDSPSIGLNGSVLGLPPALLSQLQAATIPQINVANYGTLGNARFLNFPRETHNLQVNVTKERGVHSIKFGFTAESAKLNSTDFRSADFSFSRGMTSGPTAAVDSSVTGNAIASLLLGTGSGGSAPTRIAQAVNQMYYAAYVQDTWRVNRRLTLNYGLRYEVQKPRTERFDRANYFDFNAPNPLGQRVGLPLVGGLAFVTSSDRGQWITDKVDLAPRVGLSMKLTEKLVVRAGYGIFYLQTAGTGTVTSDGFSTTTTWVSSRGGDGVNPQDLLRNPFPNGLTSPLGSSRGLETLVGESISGYQREHPSGYVQNFSIDFQYELSRGTVVELGYSGNQSRKLVYGAGRNANQLHHSFLSRGAALDASVPNPFFGRITSGVLAGQNVPAHRLLRPYPQFNALNMSADTPGASASFNALIAKFTKQFSSGLTVISSYQWSKALDNASETQGWELSEAFRNFYDQSIERSVSGHDIPQSFVTAMVYQLPVGRGKKFGAGLPGAVDAIVGGWQVSSVIRFGSGLPLGVTAPNTLSAYGFPVQRPDIADLKQLEVPERTPARWFNTAAFRAPAPYTIGNSPRWFPNLRFGEAKHADVAIMKNFIIRERWKAQLRGEFFNITNTPQFGRADTNIASGSFGSVGGTTNVGPRNVQLSLKVSF
jgi:hypothetical protein